jgi:hypothetical protein
MTAASQSTRRKLSLLASCRTRTWTLGSVLALQGCHLAPDHDRPTALSDGRFHSIFLSERSCSRSSAASRSAVPASAGSPARVFRTPGEEPAAKRRSSGSRRSKVHTE